MQAQECRYSGNWERNNPVGSNQQANPFFPECSHMRSPQAAVAVAMFVTLAGTIAVAAQELKLRTIQGRVVDEENRAVASAVVYLRDDRTNSVRTYITNSSGHYRFNWLGEYDDYELEAQAKNFHSHRHTISQWDTRRDFVIDLKLDKKQG
jgi:hypothetical protein